MRRADRLPWVSVGRSLFRLIIFRGQRHRRHQRELQVQFLQGGAGPQMPQDSLAFQLIVRNFFYFALVPLAISVAIVRFFVRRLAVI